MREEITRILCIGVFHLVRQLESVTRKGVKHRSEMIRCIFALYNRIITFFKVTASFFMSEVVINASVLI